MKGPLVVEHGQGITRNNLRNCAMCVRLAVLAGMVLAEPLDPPVAWDLWKTIKSLESTTTTTTKKKKNSEVSSPTHFFELVDR